MKKLVILSALVLVGSLSAQTFGIKAGFNFASIGNADELANDLGGTGFSAKSKLGFNAGIYMNAPVAESFSIQPELLYSTKGTEFEAAGETATIKLDYLTVPVMFQYHLVPQFYLEAGPEFGFALSSKLDYDEGTEDLKDDVNSFDFGVGLGAGYKFTSTIAVTARYVAGFTDIVKDNTSDTKYTNNVFQFGVSYGF